MNHQPMNEEMMTMKMILVTLLGFVTIFSPAFVTGDILQSDREAVGSVLNPLLNLLMKKGNQP